MAKFIFSQDKFIKILKKYGFKLKSQRGSHQKWVGTIGGRQRSVGVDVKYAEYSDSILSTMIRQSGLSRKTFKQEMNR